MYTKKTMSFLKETKPYLYRIYKEVYYRFYYFFFAFFLSCSFSWIYGKEIFYIYFFHLYHENQNFIFTTISEAFSVRFSLCIFFSLCLSAPLGGYHFLCFFSPSLFPQEHKNLYKFFILIFFSYVVSLVICSFYILPSLSSWFLQFAISNNFFSLVYIAKISTYFSWSKNMYIFFLLIFQIPVYFWIYVYFSQNKKIFYFLLHNKKYISIFLLFFCAYISPPDFYSQGFLFVFFFFLYNLFLWLFCYKKVLLNKSKKNTN